MRFPIPGILIAVGIFSAPGKSETEDDLARRLLNQALENQYHGRYQATLEMVHDDFSRGKDSLAGFLQVSDDVGERKMCLAGNRRAFEYRSVDFGREQWIVDDETRRVRRIANRQWKKGIFGNLLTYEDMLKLPADFFLEFASCRSLRITDTSYRISMTLKPVYQTFYSRLDVELSKDPVLVRTMDFFGAHGEHLKTLAVKGYSEIDGKWVVGELCLADGDSLSTLRMCFRNFSFSGPPVSRIVRKQNILLAEHPEAEPPADEDGGEESQGSD